jgi:integrase
MMMTKANSSPASGSFRFTEARVIAACRDASVDDADASGRCTWCDEECRGLRLRLNIRTGNAVYCCVRKHNGRVVRTTLGDVGVVTLKEARAAVNSLRFDKTEAARLNPRTTGKSALLRTVADAMLDAHASGEWLPGARKKTPSVRTMQNYRDVRRAQLDSHEGKTLKQFAADLPAFYSELKARAPVQSNRFLQLVRNVYSFASARGLWDGPNPADGSPASRITRAPEKVRTRILDEAEWLRLQAALEADKPLWSHLFTTSILSLARMNAVCHMRWQDLTLGSRKPEWRIPAEFMKGGEPHTVPIDGVPELVAILRKRRKLVPDGCEWVFPSAHGNGPVSSYKTAWKRILERAGLWHKDAAIRPRPHDLRRTGGAWMTEAGEPVQTVTHCLGNKPASVGMVAKTYALVTPQASRNAFRNMSQRTQG